MHSGHSIENVHRAHLALKKSRKTYSLISQHECAALKVWLSFLFLSLCRFWIEFKCNAMQSHSHLRGGSCIGSASMHLRERRVCDTRVSGKHGTCFFRWGKDTWVVFPSFTRALRSSGVHRYTGNNSRYADLSTYDR